MHIDNPVCDHAVSYTKTLVTGVAIRRIGTNPCMNMNLFTLKRWSSARPFNGQVTAHARTWIRLHEDVGRRRGHSMQMGKPMHEHEVRCTRTLAVGAVLHCKGTSPGMDTQQCIRQCWPRRRHCSRRRTTTWPREGVQLQHATRSVRGPHFVVASEPHLHIHTRCLQWCPKCAVSMYIVAWFRVCPAYTSHPSTIAKSPSHTTTADPSTSRSNTSGLHGAEEAC